MALSTNDVHRIANRIMDIPVRREDGAQGRTTLRKVIASADAEHAATRALILELLSSDDK